MSLGHMFSHGKGVETNHEVSLKHYLQAADSGLPIAQYNVGCLYFSGKGCEVDLDLAAHYFELAASEGFEYAQINLGNMYNIGYGVERDLEKAKYLYAMSAETNADAQGLLKQVEAKIDAEAAGVEQEVCTNGEQESVLKMRFPEADEKK